MSRAAPRRRASPTGPAGVRRRRPPSLWHVGIAASAGAGVIHLAQAPDHVGQLGWLGYGFVLAAVLQLGWAVAAGRLLFVRAGSRLEGAWRRVALAGVSINLAILMAWAVSRLAGLPAGPTPWTPESVGVADSITALLEGLLVVGLAASIRGREVSKLRGSLALRGATAVLAIGLIGVGTSVAVAVGESGHVHAGDAAHAEDAHAGQAAPDDALAPVGRPGTNPEFDHHVEAQEHGHGMAQDHGEAQAHGLGEADAPGQAEDATHGHEQDEQARGDGEGH